MGLINLREQCFEVAPYKAIFLTIFYTASAYAMCFLILNLFQQKIEWYYTADQPHLSGPI